MHAVTPRPPEAEAVGPLARVAAFGVHVFTASGAALALLAMVAAVERRWALMFLWLGIALLVDGVDGTLARRLRVATTVPRWSGDVLDLVVDILTYVFVPAYALLAGGLLPDGLALPLAALVVITGVLYFADTHMKTTDHYFVGFPAVWNAVAFYLFLLRPQAWIAGVVVVALAALTFVPIPFVHPFRVPRWRGVSMLLLLAWAVLALWALYGDMQPATWAKASLCAIAAFFLAAGLLRTKSVAVSEKHR